MPPDLLRSFLMSNIRDVKRLLAAKKLILASNKLDIIAEDLSIHDPDTIPVDDPDYGDTSNKIDPPGSEFFVCKAVGKTPSEALDFGKQQNKQNKGIPIPEYGDHLTHLGVPDYFKAGKIEEIKSPADKGWRSIFLFDGNAFKGDKHDVFKYGTRMGMKLDGPALCFKIKPTSESGMNEYIIFGLVSEPV
jgi:hypothetical protein